MKNIITNISSDLFDGFYESIHCNSDEFIDVEMEDKDILDNFLFFINNKNDIEVEYEYDNWDEYKNHVCEIFIELYIEKIIDELPYNITESDDFKLDIVGEVDVVSPKYYNYATDKCYVDIETNYETLNMIKKYTLSQSGAKEYLIKYYTSKDGFISFISNDIMEWKDKDIQKYEENEISALLDMLLLLSNQENGNDLNEETYYSTDKYSYAYPVCYIKGKKYNLYSYVDNVIRKIKSKYPMSLGFNIYLY